MDFAIPTSSATSLTSHTGKFALLTVSREGRWGRTRLAAHLIRQPVALLLLPALCNIILLVANNSRQLRT